MTLKKLAAMKGNKRDTSSNRSRALSLLMEEMAVWFPAPYFDIDVMVYQETKDFKSDIHS